MSTQLKLLLVLIPAALGGLSFLVLAVAAPTVDDGFSLLRWSLFLLSTGGEIAAILVLLDRVRCLERQERQRQANDAARLLAVGRVATGTDNESFTVPALRLVPRIDPERN